MEIKKTQQGYIVRLEKGEEIMTSIKKICEENVCFLLFVISL